MMGGTGENSSYDGTCARWSPSPWLVGTAGWAIPRAHADAFPGRGSALERYAGRFRCVEINTTFYRVHRPATFARWAASVPAGFRFAVKAPREVTHERRLVDAEGPMRRLLDEVAALGAALGPVLIQLPPSFAFEAGVAGRFLGWLRRGFAGEVAWEPRHASWFTQEAEALLAGHRVARVAADPAVVPRAGEPGGWGGLVYRRLHGSPRPYYSAYPEAFVDALAASAAPGWYIFDNTASGAAAGNALRLQEAVSAGEW